MHPIETAHSAATATRFSLVARHSCVVEVGAAGALVEIPAVGGHISDLLGGSGQDRLRQKWKMLFDEGMISGVGVADQGAQANAVPGFRDFCHAEPIEVDQLVGALDILFHQVQEVGSAGQESSPGVFAGCGSGAFG